MSISPKLCWSCQRLQLQFKSFCLSELVAWYEDLHQGLGSLSVLGCPYTCFPQGNIGDLGLGFLRSVLLVGAFQQKNRWAGFWMQGLQLWCKWDQDGDELVAQWSRYNIRDAFLKLCLERVKNMHLLQWLRRFRIQILPCFAAVFHCGVSYLSVSIFLTSWQCYTATVP